MSKNVDTSELLTYFANQETVTIAIDYIFVHECKLVTEQTRHDIDQL
jgi:hypothetical protein